MENFINILSESITEMTEELKNKENYTNNDIIILNEMRKIIERKRKLELK